MLSALLPNGSYVDIAKVDGDATYKAYMLGLQDEPPKIISPKYCPFSQRICQHLPFQSNQIENLLAPILEALVAAAESTLKTNVKSAGVSAYDIGTIEHKSASDKVHIASSNLGVNSYDRLDHVVRQLAPALGIQGNCSEPYTLPDDPRYHHDPEQIILTVEYTRDALTAGLWKEECVEMEMINRLKSAELGHNAMQTCRETSEDKLTFEAGFRSALRGVSADPSRDERQVIGWVLILGECADAEAMPTTLRQVLGEQFHNDDSVDL